MSETAHSAYERVCQGCLVSETACSAHGSVFRGCLVSETARSAHGRVFRGCLVSETARSAHERVCQGCLVGETARSAHGRLFRGRLVGETARSAHGRVCRCASGRRRVCVVTEESRHPYLSNSALHHRATKWYESVAQACLAALSGDDKCQKRCPGVSSWSGASNVGTLFHRHRDDGCPGVSSWSGAEGFWNDQRSINGWFCFCQRQKRIRRWHYMEKMRPS